MYIKGIGIALGLFCMAVDLYAATSKGKNLLHRLAHLGFAFVFMLLVYMIWAR